MQENITHVGRITCVLLENGDRLYGPMSLPDNLFHRRWDQLTICGANERSTEEIIAFEHLEGMLETEDKFRPASLRRWKLLEVAMGTP